MIMYSQMYNTQKLAINFLTSFSCRYGWSIVRNQSFARKSSVIRNNINNYIVVWCRASFGQGYSPPPFARIPPSSL